MVKVFSFSLFGSEDKYCKGLLKNITIIEEKFPDWQVWIYCGEGIPEDILFALHDHICVKLIPTHQDGMVNKFYRFFPIDDASVEICIIRDADSRIYERDRGCIQEFLMSDKLVHIIRDHPNHHHQMMAGMWGIKKNAIHKHFQGSTLQSLFNTWKAKRPTHDFWNDTQFLCEEIYPRVVYDSIIHDETQHFEPLAVRTKFPFPLIENHFVGQVYEFSSTQEEYQKFSYNT